MSELIKWFEKRRETKALATVQRHLSLTTEIVADLEKAIRAAIGKNEKEMQMYSTRVARGEREADELRRKVMDDISKGELSPIDRADLMELVKRVDMVADWSRESIRILNAIPMEQTPALIKDEFVEMVQNVKGCAISLQECVNNIMRKPEEALQAADTVEREEEKVDDIHEKARILMGKADLQSPGAAVLIGQFFEALEMIADSCEDACDRVRVIMVRK